MACCLLSNKDEQIELLLPSGEKIIIIVLPNTNRTYIPRVRLSFNAPDSVSIQRRPRKTKEENAKETQESIGFNQKKISEEKDFNR